MYDLSKCASTYVAIGHVGNGGTVGTGVAQNGVITRIKHSF